MEPITGIGKTTTTRVLGSDNFEPPFCFLFLFLFLFSFWRRAVCGSATAQRSPSRCPAAACCCRCAAGRGPPISRLSASVGSRSSGAPAPASTAAVSVLYQGRLPKTDAAQRRRGGVTSHVVARALCPLPSACARQAGKQIEYLTGGHIMARATAAPAHWALLLIVGRLRLALRLVHTYEAYEGLGLAWLGLTNSCLLGAAQAGFHEVAVSDWV